MSLAKLNFSRNSIIKSHLYLSIQEGFQRVSNQEKDISKLETVIETLLSGNKLDQHYKDHSMVGKWKNHRDCHIEPDWILIYRLTKESLILERTGSHSELFK